MNNTTLTNPMLPFLSSQNQDNVQIIKERQIEEFAKLQQLIQQNESYHTLGPIEHVKGKSFTSTYDVNHQEGLQSDKDIKL